MTENQLAGHGDCGFLYLAQRINMMVDGCRKRVIQLCWATQHLKAGWAFYKNQKWFKKPRSRPKTRRQFDEKAPHAP